MLDIPFSFGVCESETIFTVYRNLIIRYTTLETHSPFKSVSYPISNPFAQLSLVDLLLRVKFAFATHSHNLKIRIVNVKVKDTTI